MRDASGRNGIGDKSGLGGGSGASAPDVGRGGVVAPGSSGTHSSVHHRESTATLLRLDAAVTLGPGDRARSRRCSRPTLRSCSRSMLTLRFSVETD